MSLSHSPSVVMNGLVLYLDAANSKSYPGTGTTWTDLSGAGNNGTLTNGPTYSSSNGGAIVFDGVNDYVDVVDTPLRMSNTFSICCWFYWNGVNQQTNILGKRNGSSPYNQYVIGFVNNPYNGGTSNKLMVFARQENGSESTDVYLTYALPSAGHYYASAVLSASNQYFYVNSILRGSSTKNLTGATYNINGKNFLVGSSVDVITPFNGNISSVSIYNRALSAAEIAQNFNSTRSRFGI